MMIPWFYDDIHDFMMIFMMNSCLIFLCSPMTLMAQKRCYFSPGLWRTNVGGSFEERTSRQPAGNSPIWHVSQILSTTGFRMLVYLASRRIGKVVWPFLLAKLQKTIGTQNHIFWFVLQGFEGDKYLESKSLIMSHVWLSGDAGMP